MRGHGFLCLIHVEMSTSSLISILNKLLGNHYTEKQIAVFSHVYRETEERKKNQTKSFCYLGAGAEERNSDAKS